MTDSRTRIVIGDDPNAAHCIRKFNIDVKKLEQALNSVPVPDDDSNLNRYMGCVWNQLGKIDGNGNVKVEAIENLVDQVVMSQTEYIIQQVDDLKESIVSKCKNLTGRCLGQKVRTPTVYPREGFSVVEDGETLRAAMKGFGTDEDAVIDIICTRSNWQRQQIATFFEEQLGRDLIDDLKSELGGNFEDVVVALVRPPTEYLCKHLHKAMKGAGTNEDTLIEILCTRNNDEIREIVETYEQMYDRPLAEQMCSETAGDLRRLLTFIVTGTRDDSNEVDVGLAREQAEELYSAGEGRLGTEESTFSKILGHENFDQLRQIFEEYKNISGNTIEQALKHEVDGDYLKALLAIVECVQSPPAYFAKRLYDAMIGAGTDDETLIRIIVSRSEIDLGSIKEEFERIYDKTLESMVANETSGDYKHALLALLR